MKICCLTCIDINVHFLLLKCFRCADGGVFAECGFRNAVDAGDMGFPEDAPLPGGDQPCPFAIVADDAFPLKTWIMKPYPQRLMKPEERIFNYRLSRARRIVENAFGIMAHRCVITVTHCN